MKQSTALEIMKSGKNVFLTGQAGCYDKDTTAGVLLCSAECGISCA